MTFDPVSQLLSAIDGHGPQTYVWAFVAGAASSLGPCVLPRCLAAAGMSNGSFRALMVRFAMLQSGLTTGYCMLGLGSAVVVGVVRHSAVFYAVLAIVLCISGAYVLLRERAHCGHAQTYRELSSGAAFVSGASFAFVISPCCTPIVIALASLSATPGYAASLMAAFAAGHGVPMLAAMMGAQTLRSRVHTDGVLRASSSISGTLLVALGAYYAVLA